MSFGLRVNLPKSKKNAGSIKVAFPRGTTFRKRGARCTVEQWPQGCPKKSLLGGGSMHLSIAHPSLPAPFPCELTAFSVWNAASWPGYLLEWRFAEELECHILMDEGVIGFPGRFRKNVLTVDFPNLEPLVAEDGSGQVALRDLFFGAGGKTKAGVPLLRTPRRCNRDIGWRSAVTVKFEDGSAKRFPTRHRCHG